MSKRDDEGDAQGRPKVGYKKPPKCRQWPPGQSGNPAGGSQRRRTSLGEVFAKEINRRRPLQMNGKRVVASAKQITPKRLYHKATNDGDTWAFGNVLEIEAGWFREARAPSDPSTAFKPEPGQIKFIFGGSMGTTWKSHCDTCGKPLYGEIDAARIEYQDRGETMPRVHYSGPAFAEETERYERYCKEQDAADQKRTLAFLAKALKAKDLKASRKRKDLSFAGLVVKEGNKRVLIKVAGKEVRLTQREIAAQRQAEKAMQGDKQAILLLRKYADLLTVKPSQVGKTEGRPILPYPIRFTLDFDEPPPPCYCAVCRQRMN